MNDILRDKLRNIPINPGCYIMRDRNSRIIYVGKAKSLRKRVQSYFRSSTYAKATPKLRSLINSVEDIEFITVKSEAEALLTESKLIKDYKPRYNIVFRDDKRYLALCVERTLEYPKLTEKRIIKNDGNEYLGPFPSSSMIHLVKDFVEKKFGIRKCSPPCPDSTTYKHCMNDVVAFCSAPCVNKISKDDYIKRFEESIEFLKHGNDEIIEDLKDKMMEASNACDFEKAAFYRDTITALDEIINQKAKKNLQNIASNNNGEIGCNELQELLNLPTYPNVIEGFDISHISGTLTVASMVVSVNGYPSPNRYKRFRIKTVDGINDPMSIAEVVGRRYKRCLEENIPLPDLVMLDGGLTQLRAAREVLSNLGLEHLPTVGLAEKFEIIVVDKPGVDEIILPKDTEALKVLIRLRDEAHRFAITYNRSLRLKKIKESLLDEIPGIGETRKIALLKHFGSVKRISNAKVEEVASVANIGTKLAAEIIQYVNSK